MFSPISAFRQAETPAQAQPQTFQATAYIPDELIDPRLLVDSFQSSAAGNTSPQGNQLTDPLRPFHGLDAEGDPEEVSHSGSSDRNTRITTDASPVTQDPEEEARYAALRQLAIQNEMEPEAIFALADFVRNARDVPEQSLPDTNSDNPFLMADTQNSQPEKEPEPLPQSQQLIKPSRNVRPETQPTKKRAHDPTLSGLAAPKAKRAAILVENADNPNSKAFQAYCQREKRSRELGITMRDYQKIIHALQVKNPNMSDEEKAAWGIPEKSIRRPRNMNTGRTTKETRKDFKLKYCQKIGLDPVTERKAALNRQMDRLGIKNYGEYQRLSQKAKGLGISLERLCEQEGKTRPMTEEARQLLEMASTVKQSNQERYQQSLKRLQRLGLTHKELASKRKSARAQGLSVEELIAKEREARAAQQGITVEQLIEKEPQAHLAQPVTRKNSFPKSAGRHSPKQSLWVHFKSPAIKKALEQQSAEPRVTKPRNKFVDVEHHYPGRFLIMRIKEAALNQALAQKASQAPLPASEYPHAPTENANQ